MATARTAIAVAGLGYAAVSLGSACLDHYEESFGGCPVVASDTPRAGSGEGSGAVGASSADCGAPAAQKADAGTGSGSGSAAAP